MHAAHDSPGRCIQERYSKPAVSSEHPSNIIKVHCPPSACLAQAAGAHAVRRPAGVAGLRGRRGARAGALVRARPPLRALLVGRGAALALRRQAVCRRHVLLHKRAFRVSGSADSGGGRHCIHKVHSPPLTSITSAELAAGQSTRGSASTRRLRPASKYDPSSPAAAGGWRGSPRRRRRPAQARAARPRREPAGSRRPCRRAARRTRPRGAASRGEQPSAAPAASSAQRHRLGQRSRAAAATCALLLWCLWPEVTNVLTGRPVGLHLGAPRLRSATRRLNHVCAGESGGTEPPYKIKSRSRAWPVRLGCVWCAPLPARRGQAAATRPVRARLVFGHLSGPASPSSPSAGGAARLAGRLEPSLIATCCCATGQ
jgi:hypothetical protein